MKRRFAPFIATCLVASIVAGSTAHAATRSYLFIMNGPSENPPNGSTGTATGTAIYDDVAGTLALTATFAGFQGTVTQTHFHGVTTVSGLPDNNPVGETPSQAAAAVPNASIAIGNTTLPGFPLGVNNGTYINTLNLNDPSIYRTQFINDNGGTVAGARAAFVGSLASGRTYWNIHSSSFGGGEVRGFPVPIPEPATMGLMGLSLAALAIQRRRK